MAFLTQRYIQSALVPAYRIEQAQCWDTPEKITLPVAEGVAALDKPPVRIFLGTEAAQYRAERIFIWSIEQVRNPARVYEIYLMKSLKGFKSRFWLTGFTNYRFAIPFFAGATGRAIYNDVDQIYLKDPAELFDLPMGDHGYLAISPGDISVALYDCEKMSQVWSLDDAQKLGKNVLLDRAKDTQGLWGEMDGGWNARDHEYIEGESGVLHYTILHRQPWHPFPTKFVYQKNDFAAPWYALERSANDCGYQIFSVTGPSRSFSSMRAKWVEDNDAGSRTPSILTRQSRQLSDLLERLECKSLLNCHLESQSNPRNQQLAIPLSGSVDSLESVNPMLNPTFKGSPVSDAVACTGTLEFFPDEDIPWLLRELFNHAGKLLFCTVSTPRGNNVRTARWWRYHFEIAARQFPDVHWQLHLDTGKVAGQRHHIIEGNNCHGDRPLVWIINDNKPGHKSQSDAIAEMIGWPYKPLMIEQNASNLISVLSGIPSSLSSPSLSAGSAINWPDVIVACGWWPCHVARYLKTRSGGKIRLVLGGRKNGGVQGVEDIAINCEHFHLPTDHRRIETLLPLHPLTNEAMEQAKRQGDERLASLDSPRVALLVGGSAKQYQFTEADAANLAERALAQTKQLGGSLLVVTSRRTGNAQSAALAQVLGDEASLYVWEHGKPDNPYLEYLASADILIVTGESESMLTDAISTGKPTYIYPLTAKKLNPLMATGHWLLDKSVQKPKNRRGTERPQQGFEYLCARLLQLEWVLPPRDLESLHTKLIRHGYAKLFGEQLETTEPAQQYRQPDLGPSLRRMLNQARYEATGNGYSSSAALSTWPA